MVIPDGTTHLLLSWRTHDEVAPVIRLTPTQAITNQSRWRRSDGSEVGAGRSVYWRATARPATDEDRARLARLARLARARRRLESLVRTTTCADPEAFERACALLEGER